MFGKVANGLVIDQIIDAAFVGHRWGHQSETAGIYEVISRRRPAEGVARFEEAISANAHLQITFQSPFGITQNPLDKIGLEKFMTPADSFRILLQILC